MDRFEERWHAAVEAARRALTDGGVSASDASMLQQGLARLGFPGRLAFLGGGRDGDGPVDGQLIEAAAELAARQPALAQHGVDAAMAARVLRAILIDRRAPTDLLADESLQAAALEAAAHVLASHGVGVS